MTLGKFFFKLNKMKPFVTWKEKFEKNELVLKYLLEFNFVCSKIMDLKKGIFIFNKL